MKEHPDMLARRERCVHEVSVLEQAVSQLQQLPAELAAHLLPISESDDDAQILPPTQMNMGPGMLKA